MNSADRIKCLASEEVENLYAGVLLHSRRYRWIENRPLGESVEDIVQETFQDILKGARNIGPDQPLLQGMCLIVRSKVNHLWEAGKGLCAIEGDKVAMTSFPDVLDQLSREYPQLCAPVEITERQAIYNEICHGILNLVAGDEVLTAIVKLWFETPDLKPQDIAQKLGLEMTTVRQAQKRLRSRVRTLREVQTDVQFA